MQQKCDAWREEVEKLSPLRDEVAQLHQENARLKQELAQVSEDNTGLARQLQETNVMKMVIKCSYTCYAECHSFPLCRGPSRSWSPCGRNMMPGEKRWRN